MNVYWITFTDGSEGCCEGFNEADAKNIARHLEKKEVAKIEVLPYPAEPVIWQFDHPVMGKCPAFCRDPNGCAGHGSCPKPYSCTE